MDILLLSSLDNILFRFRGLSLDCLNFSCLNKMDNKFNKDFTNSGVLVLLGGDIVWDSKTRNLFQYGLHVPIKSN